MDFPPFTPGSGSLHVLLVLLGLIPTSTATPSTSSGFLCVLDNPAAFLIPFDLPEGAEGMVERDAHVATPWVSMGHLLGPQGHLVLAAGAGLSLCSVPMLPLPRLSPHTGGLGQTVHAVDC